MPRQLEFRQNANTISRLQKSGVQVGSDFITLSYLKSCVREEITGGIVTVGSEQSDVQSSLVKRGKVDCDATKMLTAPRQGNDAAGVVFKEFVQAAPKMPAPEFKLYGLCPLFELRGAGKLVVQRLDTPGERLEFTIGSHKLVRDAFFDFADEKISLSPGGIYIAAWLAHQAIFEIDASAGTCRTPIIGRWLTIDPKG